MTIMLRAIGMICFMIFLVGSGTVSAQTQLRVGYGKFGTLILLKANGILEKRLAPQGVTVTWTEFNGGLKLLEGINLGSIDFGVAGDAPPILAQAAGAPILYVGHEPPSPTSEAVIVRKDSKIQTIADLKGKSVALNKGGNTHFLLVKLLEKAGLKADDVTYAWLPPADARAAFERGSIDAWAIWDPFLADVMNNVEVRKLADGTSVGVNNTLFYFTSSSYAKANPEIINIVLQEIRKIGLYTKGHVNEVAGQLASQTGISEKALQVALGRMGYGLHPMDAETVASQQDLADTFLRIGVIPKAIRVESIVKIMEAKAAP